MFHSIHVASGNDRFSSHLVHGVGKTCCDCAMTTTLSFVLCLFVIAWICSIAFKSCTDHLICRIDDSTSAHSTPPPMPQVVFHKHSVKPAPFCESGLSIQMKNKCDTSYLKYQLGLWTFQSIAGRHSHLVSYSVGKTRNCSHLAFLLSMSLLSMLPLLLSISNW